MVTLYMGFCSKGTCISFVKHFIVWMQMCFLLEPCTSSITAWPAREIVESESIQEDHDRAFCSTELSVNYRLTSRLHASKKKKVISLHWSGLCFIQIAAINAAGILMYQSVNLIFI